MKSGKLKKGSKANDSAERRAENIRNSNNYLAIKSNHKHHRKVTFATTK